MTPVRGAQPPLTAWDATRTQESIEITAGEWLAIGVGLLAALLTLAAVVIAWRQLRSRHAAHAKEAELGRVESAEIRVLLKKLGVRTHKVQANGPYTRDQLTALDLDTLRAETGEVASRATGRLGAHLLAMTTKIHELMQAAVPEESEVISAYTAAGATPIQSDLQPLAVQRQAIRQDRVAGELSAMIKEAWRLVDAEWGGHDH